MEEVSRPSVDVQEGLANIVEAFRSHATNPGVTSGPRRERLERLAQTAEVMRQMHSEGEGFPLRLGVIQERLAEYGVRVSSGTVEDYAGTVSERFASDTDYPREIYTKR